VEGVGIDPLHDHDFARDIARVNVVFIRRPRIGRGGRLAARAAVAAGRRGLAVATAGVAGAAAAVVAPTTGSEQGTKERGREPERGGALQNWPATLLALQRIPQ